MIIKKSNLIKHHTIYVCTLANVILFISLILLIISLNTIHLLSLMKAQL